MNFEELMTTGNEHFDSEEYEQAIHCHSKALALKPKDIYAHIFLMMDYLAHNNEEKAQEYFAKSLDIDLLGTIGYIVLLASKGPDGSAKLHEIIEESTANISTVNLANAESYVFLFCAYAELQQYYMMPGILEQASFCLLTRGAAFLLQGELQPAIKDLERAIKLNPKSPQATILLATLSSEMQEQQVAAKKALAYLYKLNSGELENEVPVVEKAAATHSSSHIAGLFGKFKKLTFVQKSDPEEDGCELKSLGTSSNT